MRRWWNRPAVALALAMAVLPAVPAVSVAAEGRAQAVEMRNGLEIYQSFREGLAHPECGEEVSERWRKHYAAAPGRLASRDDDTLALFGYVVDAVRAAHLPSEYALIPFIESGYRPDARSPSGPLGLWQMIKLTARNHKVPMRPGYDGRLSPVDSTRAAVRYLKTLHGMFAGDWRLAVMAYNAGEYRILGALKRNGQVAADARPAQLEGLPRITQAYVRKLHALACVLADADDGEAWVQAMDRPVPRLTVVELPGDIARVREWARQFDQDAERLRRLNPVYEGGRINRAGERPAPLLAGSPRLPPAEQGVAPAPADAVGGTAGSR